MGYDAGKLSLQQQTIAGPKKWLYLDTGGESVATYQGSGYFTDAKDRGVDTGDRIEIVNLFDKNFYNGKFTAVQDTGATQGTVDIVQLDTGGA